VNVTSEEWLALVVRGDSYTGDQGTEDNSFCMSTVWRDYNWSSVLWTKSSHLMPSMGQWQLVWNTLNKQWTKFYIPYWTSS